MTPDDDKPLTPAQARQKLQTGRDDYLAGNDPGPIVFRLKRTKKASETYPLKLTQQQRETLLQLTQLSRNLKYKIEQAREGTQVVPVTWNELHKLNDETGQAAVYARSADKKRLMAVMGRVIKFFEEEHAEVFGLEAPTPEAKSKCSATRPEITMSKQKPSAVSKFSVGDRVRVKHSLRDTNYLDLPIGGWAGSVAEVHKDGMYTVRWSKETLGKIHPVFRNRCERDGFEYDEYWLSEADLEPDPGSPLDIEQPTEIETKPLSPKVQDDRIRMVFGLTSNDPLPCVDDEALVAYHHYRSKHLVFPFVADHRSEYGHPEQVKVLGLGEPDKEPVIDDEHGILCEARLEGDIVTLPLGELENARGQPNRRLLDDYCYWLLNWG